MKRIRFIRHGAPAGLDADYSKLTFQQLCDLATLRIEPGTDVSVHELAARKLLGQNFSVIISSGSRRTTETAKRISTASSRRVFSVEDPNLREISFDPSVLTTEARFREYGMPEIRESLFHGMMTGVGAESIQKAFRRIRSVERALAQTSGDSVLCITHGFFMRLLHLYFVAGATDYRDMASDLLLQAPNYPYLDGFEITIE